MDKLWGLPTKDAGGQEERYKTVRDGVRVADSPPELLALANVRQKADSRCRRFLRRVRHRN